LWNESGKLSEGSSSIKQAKGGHGSTENVIVVGEGVMVVDGDASRKRPSLKNQAEKENGHDNHENISVGNGPKETIDAILCPAAPGAAPPLDCARYWVGLSGLVSINFVLTQNRATLVSGIWWTGLPGCFL